MRSSSPLLLVLAACGGGTEPVAPVKTAPTTATAPVPWPTPAGWRSETIPFPLGFAPSVAHRGVEEIRFAPGFFEPSAPGYWSYAFVWRTDDAATLDPGALAGELTVYFQGLVAAVDEKNRITARDTIRASAKTEGQRFTLVVHTFDAFKTAHPIDLVGWAQRTTCGTGALWVFVLAPATTPLRPQLDELAMTARCGQPVVMPERIP